MSNTFARFLHAYGHPGASQASVDSFKQKRGVNLPDDFEEFLLRSDGCNGELGEGYLQLWSVGELIGADDYEFFPSGQNRFLIGSNAGSTAYAVYDGNFISVPFVFSGPIEEEIEVLGRNFAEFVAAIEHGKGS